MGVGSAAAQTSAPGGVTPETTTDTPGVQLDEGEIIVTGSRIRRDPLSNQSPVTSLDTADIARTGLTSIADVLQRLPGSAGGLNSRFNRSGNNGNPPDGGGVGAGSAEIDLRYLGSRRTLVLVDGVRFINGASASGIPGAVDLNAIPEGMIERVEVLRDGASTIYGSDAIAGVVNIISKTRQDGFLISGQAGAYDKGDGVTQSYNASWGTHNENTGTSIVIGANYNKQGSVFAGDRDHYSFPVPGATACTNTCSGTVPNGHFVLVNPAGGSYDLTLRNGPVTGIPRYDPSNPYASPDFKQFQTADRYNFRPENYLLTPNERIGAFVNFKQDLGGSVRFSGKAIYNRRTSVNQAAFIPISIGPDAGNGNGSLLDRISVDVTNPYNPFGMTLSAGTDGSDPTYNRISRRLVEAGPRRFSQEVNTMFVGGTLDGNFKIGERTWYWDVNASYGENNARQTMTGNVNAARLAQALGPVADCTGACVPFNIFGGAGTVSQAMLDYVSFVQHDKSDQGLVDATANLSGSLFDLPAGPLGIAVGYEHRRQRGSFTPDMIVSAGLSSDIPALPSKGSFSVNEVYGELSVPILKDVPFFQMLEGSFAVRYSDYSTSGTSTTLKAGGNWMPVEDLRLRGTWAQGFRAPSIGELFGALSRFDGAASGITDPCSSLNDPGVSAATRAICIGQGVPANGTYVAAGPGFSLLTGGNIDLKPEKSESYVFGGVYSPGWARDAGFASALSLEVDYYTIRVDNAIGVPAADVLVDSCYNRGDPLSCAAFTRTSSGAIAEVRGTLQNIAAIKTRGLDVVFNYRTPHVFDGTFGLNVSSNFLFNYSVALPTTDGTRTTRYAGLETGDPQAYAKFKSTAVLDYSSRTFLASLSGRYISKVTEPESNASHVMKATFYLDAQVGFTPAILNEAMTVTVGVNNVLGKQAPDCLSCGGFDPTTYDMPDQFGYARVAVKF